MNILKNNLAPYRVISLPPEAEFDPKNQKSKLLEKLMDMGILQLPMFYTM